MNYEIVRLIDKIELKEMAARWFHEKWSIPLEAYLESMDDCLEKKGSIPQWYLAISNNNIIGGVGVIENDFHDRKDLTPNVCALYVEEKVRGRGIARKLLDYVCVDMKDKGIHTLYLVTNHDSLYERYGWEFLCNVNCDDGVSRMYIHKSE